MTEIKDRKHEVLDTQTINQLNFKAVPEASKQFKLLDPIAFMTAKRNFSFGADMGHVRKLSDGMYQVGIKFISGDRECSIGDANIFRVDDDLCVMVPVEIRDNYKTKIKNYRVILRHENVPVKI